MKYKNIAGKINRRWAWRLLFFFSLQNLFVLLLAAFLNLQDDIRIWQDLGAFLHENMMWWLPLLILQGIVLVTQFSFGKTTIRRDLKPLEDMAEMAEKLSKKVASETKRMEHLEHAIQNMSAQGQERLETGHKDLKEIEQAINEVIAQMHDFYRRQHQFVSDASHELRTPLAVIEGYVNMLDRWGKEDETILNESIEALKSECEHMKRLVEALLFLARGDSGQTKMNKETVNVNELLQELYDQSILINKTHKFRKKVPDETIEVQGDFDLLKQMLRILSDNAAKYSPPDSVITLAAEADASGAVRLIVQDEGVGMRADEVPQMFKRFYRADRSRAKSTGGTGLGLSIAEWIASKHNGHFEVLSWEDVGTRVTVCLPSE